MKESKDLIGWVEAHAARHPLSAWDELAKAPSVEPGWRFLPEALTPMAHHPLYATWSDQERLRYNQLSGLCFLDIFTRLEKHFVVAITQALQSRELDPRTHAMLGRFAEDERTHIRAWQVLAQKSDPARAVRGGILGPMPFLPRLILPLMTSRPWRFPLTLWLMLASEERVTTTDVLIQQDEGVHPLWRKAFLWHHHDELRHVAMDSYCLAQLTRSQPKWQAKLNGGLLEHIVDRYFITPSHAGWYTACCLMEEFPRLKPMRGKIRQALMEVGTMPAWRRLMFSHECCPQAMAELARWSHAAGLYRKLTATCPQEIST